MKQHRRQIERKDKEYDAMGGFVHLRHKIETSQKMLHVLLIFGNCEEKGQ